MQNLRKIVDYFLLTEIKLNDGNIDIDQLKKFILDGKLPPFIKQYPSLIDALSQFIELINKESITLEVKKYINTHIKQNVSRFFTYYKDNVYVMLKDIPQINEENGSKYYINVIPLIAKNQNNKTFIGFMRYIDKQRDGVFGKEYPVVAKSESDMKKLIDLLDQNVDISINFVNKNYPRVFDFIHDFIKKNYPDFYDAVLNS